MYFWWPIVYTYLLLVNQSVRMELFDSLFFIHTSKRWPKFYKYHLFMFVVFEGLFWQKTSPFLTSSIQVPPLLHEFYGLFCLFFSSSWAWIYLRDNLWLHVHVLLVTYTSWLWHILYIKKILMFYSVNIPPHFLPHVHDLVCTLVIFMVYFVFLLLDELILRDILWLRAHTSGDLFCTGTSSWWPILYIRNFLIALSLHLTPNVYLFSISTNS